MGRPPRRTSEAKAHRRISKQPHAPRARATARPDRARIADLRRGEPPPPLLHGVPGADLVAVLLASPGHGAVLAHAGPQRERGARRDAAREREPRGRRPQRRAGLQQLDRRGDDPGRAGLRLRGRAPDPREHGPLAGQSRPDEVRAHVWARRAVLGGVAEPRGGAEVLPYGGRPVRYDGC